MDDIAGHGVGSRIGNRAQSQAVDRALIHVRRATDRNRRRNVVDRDRLRVRPVEESAILVDQVDGDRPRGGAVGVGVRLRTGRRVRARVPIAPMHDVVSDGVLTRVSDSAQSQRVDRALVHVRRAADRDRRRDVDDRHRLGVGTIDEGAVLVDQVDGDRARRRAVGIGVRLRTVARIGIGVAVAPMDDVAGDRVLTRIGDCAQGQRVDRALVDVRAPLIAIDGATLSTVTDFAFARSRKVPSSSTRSTVIEREAGPSA